MAEKQLKTTIILRNDTAENWVAKDPVLKQGEAAVDNSSRKIKVGTSFIVCDEESRIHIAVNFL